MMNQRTIYKLLVLTCSWMHYSKGKLCYDIDPATNQPKRRGLICQDESYIIDSIKDIPGIMQEVISESKSGALQTNGVVFGFMLYEYPVGKLFDTVSYLTLRNYDSNGDLIEYYEAPENDATGNSNGHRSPDDYRFKEGDIVGYIKLRGSTWHYKEGIIASIPSPNQLNVLSEEDRKMFTSNEDLYTILDQDDNTLDWNIMIETPCVFPLLADLPAEERAKYEAVLSEYKSFEYDEPENAELKSILNEESVYDMIYILESKAAKTVSVEQYRKMVDYLRFQLVNRWCLCKYCQLFDSDNPKYLHWIAELRICLDYLKFHHINGEEDKQSLLQQMLVRDYDYNSPDMIDNIINHMFTVSRITDNDEKVSVVTEFTAKIDEIIQVISQKDVKTEDYILSEFGSPIV